MREFKFFHGINRHKFTVIWTPALEDVSAYHNIDAEAELTALLSEEITRNIDEEIITRLVGRVNGTDDLYYLNHFINMGGGNRA